MWAEGASEERHINLQVADVLKPLLSLSRCADMGFESRFGRLVWALIDEATQAAEVLVAGCASGRIHGDFKAAPMLDRLILKST